MKKATTFLIYAFICVASFGQAAIKASSIKEQFTLNEHYLSVLHFSADSVLTIDSISMIKRIIIKDKPAILITNEDFVKTIEGLLSALHQNLTGIESDKAIELIQKYFGFKK